MCPMTSFAANTRENEQSKFATTTCPPPEPLVISRARWPRALLMAAVVFFAAPGSADAEFDASLEDLLVQVSALLSPMSEDNVSELMTLAITRLDFEDLEREVFFDRKIDALQESGAYSTFSTAFRQRFVAIAIGELGRRARGYDQVVLLPGGPAIQGNRYMTVPIVVERNNAENVDTTLSLRRVGGVWKVSSFTYDTYRKGIRFLQAKFRRVEPKNLETELANHLVPSAFQIKTDAP